MNWHRLRIIGLSPLLAGVVGRIAPRGDGTTPVDDGQAAGIVGGQYCSYYTTHNACGGAAKHSPINNSVLTYCPIEQDTDYNPFYGVSGTRGSAVLCAECGVPCGSYDPLNVCGN